MSQSGIPHTYGIHSESTQYRPQTAEGAQEEGQK